MQEELIYDDLQPSEVASDIPVEEVTYAIEVTDVEAVQIDVDEAFPSFGEADALNHALLTNRELHDAHPITAITGLREELDSIEALQTLYSDKKGNADYYEWADGLALGENGVGYFVSLNQDVRTISICTGDDIFGVVVPSAAFVGGQDNVARDDHYGLVATTGAVHVRCELDVTVGDYVVSNTYGVATSTNSGHGYKVVALHDINGVSYATINLNISADQVDSMGTKLQNLDSRMGAAESNIISAINVAHEAYNKAGEMIIISGDASQKAQDALDTFNKVLDSVESLEDAALKSQQIAAQAKAIADGALVSAESIRKEAVDEANNALAEAAKLRDEFALMEEGINEVEDQIAIVAKKVNGKYTVVASWSEANKESDVVYYAEDTKLYWYYDSNIWKSTDDPSVAGLPMALSGLQVEVDEHSASINGLVDWRDDTNYAMARIEQKADANGAYIQSTVSNMNKYAVGPHSQAYGFTLEQAASVLEEGMMYVPTDDVTEEYEYTENDTVKVYQRSFTRGYLYRWGTPDGYPGGWITIDKNYSEVKLNTSAPAVYFATQPPSVSGNFGYWYTNGDNVAEGYEPYTLYKWDLPYKYQTQKDDGTIVDVEEYHWIAVATLAGNSQSRAVSQIRQNANSIETSVITLQGDYAGTKTWVDENKAAIQDVVTWKGQNADSITTFMQEAGDNFASAAQVAKIVDKDGTVKESAIVTAVNNNISSISLSADNIQFTGQKLNIKVDATNIDGTLTIGQLPNTVAETSDILTKTSQLTNDSGFQNSSQVTTITNNTISTTTVTAQNLKVKAANIDGKLTADQINANGLEVTNGTFSGSVSCGDNFTVTSAGKVTIKSGDIILSENRHTTSINGAMVLTEGINGGLMMSGYGLTATSGDNYKQVMTATPTGSTLWGGWDVQGGNLNFYSNASQHLRVYGTGNNPFISLYNGNITFHFAGDGTITNAIYSYGTSKNTAYAILSGDWRSTSDIEVNSDRNKKNNIEVMPSEYELIFDMLQPVIYKYNDGKSDRYHIGFIAQDVEDAVISAGLTTKDFAAVCYDIDNDGNKTNYGVRYGEIVALNTAEIQKLKSRVSELETRVTELEGK